MITIELNDGELQAALNHLFNGFSDLSDPMDQIGDYLVGSTKRRFGDQTAPDGTPWAARSPVTIARYLAQGGGFGGILHRSGDLGSYISHTFGPDFAEVSSDRPYAAMMQFGGTKAQWPHLWGNIPARPFLGLSDEDEGNVLDIVEEWVAGLAGEPL